MQQNFASIPIRPRYAKALLTLLLPSACLVCKRPLRGALLCWRCYPAILPKGSQQCSVCRNATISSPARSDQSPLCTLCTLFPLPFNSLRYLWRYEDTARDVIKTMKYAPSLILCRWIGEMLGSEVRAHNALGPWECIVPIPASYTTLKRRQFNQCEIMAHEIAKRVYKDLRWKISVRDVLRAKRRRAPQATLLPAQRVAGMSQPFTVSKQLSEKRILLIDDVVTSGATIAAASIALRSAGATQVDVLAAAVAPSWSRYRARIFHKYCRYT